MLARNKDLFKEHDDDTPTLLLAYAFHANDSTAPIPYFISLGLQDHDDVFSKKLLDGFPLLRGIEHQIDFVLGSGLPNEPAYRSNPEDTK